MVGMEVRRILIVDDEASIRRSLRAYLEDEGFEVATAGSGESGLDRLALDGFDATIVDIRLPGMDGNVFMERARDLCPHMLFLICTGSVGYELPENLQSGGMGRHEVFEKPLRDMSVLSAVIRKRLGMRCAL
jgi:two-component system, OmpR family, response regulator